jgi:hypothetical protein
MQKLKKLKQKILRFRPNRKKNQVLILPTVPNIPDFHLFGHLKDSHRGRRFAGDDLLEHYYVKSSDASAKRFTPSAYSVTRKGGRSFLIMKETFLIK